MCHAAEPVWAGIPAAPKGVLLDSDEQIRVHAPLIDIVAVRSNFMPPGNITEMTTRSAWCSHRGSPPARRRNECGTCRARPFRGIRGRLLSFLRAPSGAGDAQSYRYIDDGIVLIAGDGRIEAAGPAAELLPRLPADAQVAHHPGALIMPGFIDPHIHYPQTQVIASYGAQLLEWLEKYTFVEEQKFADREHAARNAEFFLDELFRNGTTTACAYCTAHPVSADALFTAAHKRNAGMIAGNSVMNRNGPPGLLAPAASAIADSRELIKRWHGTGRQRYAVTPRFAITSTDAQLAELGALLNEFPTVLMQTHLDENLDEIAAIKKLFPNDASYTAVYDRFGLLGPRSLMGHCIHMDDCRSSADAGGASGRGVLPDLEPLHRLRSVQLRAASRRRRAHCAGNRRRRRHVLFHAAHRRRGL